MAQNIKKKHIGRFIIICLRDFQKISKKLDL